MRSPEHQEFAAALHKMLGAAGDPWPKLTDMGVTSLDAPLDLVVACEELGHHAVPGPVAESLAVAPLLISTRQITTLAIPPRLPYAADAGYASLVLLVTGGAVHRAELGARHESVDPSRTLHEVRAVEELRPSVPAEAFEMGVLATAAYLAGAGQALLEMSVRHATIREQFGRPIGTNQAVQHRLADVAIGLEFARPLLDEAAGSLSPRDISAAKVACAAASYAAARAALQVHGAIGYTAEHELSRFLLKVRALSGAWGGDSWHRARIMESL